MKKIDAQFIRNRITELRMQKDVSEREMSFALGKGHSYIHNIVAGIALPHMSNFLDICDYFEVTPYEFFNPNVEDPAALRKLYNQLKQLPPDELNRINDVLDHTDSQKLHTFVHILLDLLEK